jgi:glycosyltransferase involved in cell wall biosynthesis
LNTGFQPAPEESDVWRVQTDKVSERFFNFGSRPSPQRGLEHPLVTAVVLARNEEHNLSRCLSDASAVVSDLVVIDDNSTDSTRSVSEALGARVYEHGLESFAGQRNWAMEHARLHTEWVLHLDADEVVTPELAAEIQQRVETAGPEVAGFLLSYKTMLDGRWLKHSSTFPVWVLRLVRRGRVRYTERGHGEGYEADGKILRLQEPFLHYNFSKGFTEWLAKHNRYSSLEAQACLQDLRTGRLKWRALMSRDPVLRRRALKRLSFRLPFRPWLKFFYMYVLRRGFLDGMPGLTYCTLQGIYEYMICLKIKELKRREKGLPV